MNRYLASEFIASRSSSTAWLTLTALPLLFLTYTLARVVTEDPDATGILMWQSMYATGIAAPLTAMFAASAELREHHARMGGRHWRGLSMRSLRLARFVAVIACVAVFHVLNFGGTWLLAVLDGRTGANRILLLGVLSWTGAIGVAGLAMACARNTNIVITLVVFLVWQLAGTTRTIVEGPVWWAFPFAWPVRLLLPVLQVHQNAVPLEPDAALRHESPWLALLLCLVLAVAGAIIAVVTPRYRIAFRRTHQHVSTAVLREASTRRPADRPRNVLPALLPVALTPGRAQLYHIVHNFNAVCCHDLPTQLYPRPIHIRHTPHRGRHTTSTHLAHHRPRMEHHAHRKSTLHTSAPQHPRTMCKHHEHHRSACRTHLRQLLKHRTDTTHTSHPSRMHAYHDRTADSNQIRHGNHHHLGSYLDNHLCHARRRCSCQHPTMATRGSSLARNRTRPSLARGLQHRSNSMRDTLSVMRPHAAHPSQRVAPRWVRCHGV